VTPHGQVIRNKEQTQKMDFPYPSEPEPGKVKRLRILYNELLYAVAGKYAGETRHETALRYIREREERAGEAGSCKQNISTGVK
jgi:hypothetical protein